MAINRTCPSFSNARAFHLTANWTLYARDIADLNSFFSAFIQELGAKGESISSAARRLFIVPVHTLVAPAHTPWVHSKLSQPNIDSQAKVSFPGVVIVFVSGDI
jgi:hypothetical protein